MENGYDLRHLLQKSSTVLFASGQKMLKRALWDNISLMPWQALAQRMPQFGTIRAEKTQLIFISSLATGTLLFMTLRWLKGREKPLAIEPPTAAATPKDLPQYQCHDVMALLEGGNYAKAETINIAMSNIQDVKSNSK